MEHRSFLLIAIFSAADLCSFPCVHSSSSLLDLQEEATANMEVEKGPAACLTLVAVGWVLVEK